MLKKLVLLVVLTLPLGGCWSLLGIAGGASTGAMMAKEHQKRERFVSPATGKRATSTEVEAEMYKRRILSGDMPKPNMPNPNRMMPPPGGMQPTAAPARMPPPRAMAAPRPMANDGAISHSINERLLGGDLTKVFNIHSVVRNGEVDLYGNVPHQVVADRAVRTALATPGVRRVNSHLTVVEMTPPKEKIVNVPSAPRIVKIPPPAPVKPRPRVAAAPKKPVKSQAEITREQILKRKAMLEKQLSGG